MAVLVIFGNRTAVEIAEAAQLANAAMFDAIIVHYFAEPEFSETLALELEEKYRQVSFHAGVADVATKKRIVSACSSRNWQPTTVIHPSAIISPNAKIGAGVFIGQVAVVSSYARVDDHAIVHLHASIGHDSEVGEWSSVLPGARVSGNVRIGKRALIGSNAFVNAGISIGDDSQVDALTYVARDLPSGMLLSTRSPRPVPRIHPLGETQ